MDKIKYCPNCGNRLTPGGKFCEHCGQSLAAVRGEKTVDSLTQWHRTHDFKRMMQVFLVSLVVLLILSWQNIAAFFSPTTSISLNSEGFGNVLIEFALGILVYMIMFSIAVLLQVGRKKATHAWVRWLGSCALGIMIWFVIIGSLWVSWSLCCMMFSNLNEIILAIAVYVLIIIAVIMAAVMTRFLSGKVRERTMVIVLGIVIVATLIPMIIWIVMAMIKKQAKEMFPFIVMILCSLLWLFFIKKLVSGQKCTQLLHLGKVLVLPFTLAMAITLIVSTSHYDLRYNYQVKINRKVAFKQTVKHLRMAVTNSEVYINGHPVVGYENVALKYDNGWNPDSSEYSPYAPQSDYHYDDIADYGEDFNTFWDVLIKSNDDADIYDGSGKYRDETGQYDFIGTPPLIIGIEMKANGRILLQAYPAYCVATTDLRNVHVPVKLMRDQGIWALKCKMPLLTGKYYDKLNRDKRINVEFMGVGY